MSFDYKVKDIPTCTHFEYLTDCTAGCWHRRFWAPLIGPMHRLRVCEKPLALGWPERNGVRYIGMKAGHERKASPAVVICRYLMYIHGVQLPMHIIDIATPPVSCTYDGSFVL